MHDFDRQQLEFAEMGETFELPVGGQSQESLELELATELLEAQTEEELLKALRGIAKSVGQAHTRNPQAIWKVSDGLAKAAKFIPAVLAKAAGAKLPPDPGAGALIEQGARSALFPITRWADAGLRHLANIEPEAMSGEDRELEMARRYVRFARRAYANAARAPRGMAPERVARSSIVASARQTLPGLAPHLTQIFQIGGPGAGVPGAGRWHRDRGRLVIELG